MDYTKGSIKMALVLLAIPMILELSLESVFAIVDIFFVSKLGPNAIATVGLTESAITIVYSLAIGLSAGATAIVARRVGEKNIEGARDAGMQAILISLFFAIGLSILGATFADDILRMMGASDEVIKEGVTFTRIMMSSSIMIVLLFLINGIFRGAGDAAMAMRSLWIASIINIVLCPILISYFGLKGAAIATSIGRSTGVLYQLYYLFNGKQLLRLSLNKIAFNFEIIKSIINIAWPATFQFIVASGSWIVLTKLVAEIGGTNASAGYQIAIRNIVFFILPAWGLSNAAATLVGQNLGAKQADRADQSVRLAMIYNIVFMALVSIVFVLFPTPIIRFFTNDAAIIPFGVDSLRIFGVGFIFFGIGMILTQAFNGAGDTKTPTMINVVCFWLIQIPLAYFLAYNTNLNVNGVVLAVPIAETILALIAWYFFRKGAWKKVEV